MMQHADTLQHYGYVIENKIVHNIDKSGIFGAFFLIRAAGVAFLHESLEVSENLLDELSKQHQSVITYM